MILLAGSIARIAIPVEGDPEIDVPFFVITVVHEGISPEDAERLLVMPLEIELRQVEGIEEINSFAAENAGTVMVEFDADFDLDQALLDTREAVDRAKVEFPSDAEEPIVQEQSTSDFPILQINLIGDVPERMLYNIALDLRDEIEAQDGILSADMTGQREELMEAVIDPTILETYQLSTDQIINSIVSNNRLIPAGSLDNGEGRFSVKVPSIIEDPRDVLNIPIKTSGDTVITISDVAEVRRTFKDRTSYARVDGRNTISLQIVKRANYNVLDAIANAKRVAEQFRPRLPAKVSLIYSQDQAPYAESQVVELEGNIVTALGLVMIIVVAAMGLRSGIIVGLGIPASFLFSLIFIYLLGYSFNFMVMFGMLLGLGHAHRRRHCRYRIRRPQNDRGLQPPPCLRDGISAHVLAGHRIYCDHPCSLLAAHVLARRFRQVHALLAGNRLHGTVWKPVICPDIRSCHRLHFWQGWQHQQTRPT